MSDVDLAAIVMSKARKLVTTYGPADAHPITMQSLGVLVDEIDNLNALLAVANTEAKTAKDELKQAEEDHDLYVDQVTEKMQGEIDRLQEDLKAARLVQPHAFVQRNARSTSVKAAQSVLGRSGSQRVRILQYIAGQKDTGATDDECALVLDMMPPRVASRRAELTSGQYVSPNGQERKTRTGQDAVVWIATDKAFDALRALETQKGS